MSESIFILERANRIYAQHKDDEPCSAQRVTGAKWLKRAVHRLILLDEFLLACSVDRMWSRLTEDKFE